MQKILRVASAFALAATALAIAVAGVDSSSAQGADPVLCVVGSGINATSEEDIIATFSSDGSTIAFERYQDDPGRAVVVERVDGTGSQLVLPGRGSEQSALSSDGQIYAYSSSSTILVYEATGGVFGGSPVDEYEGGYGAAMSGDGAIIVAVEAGEDRLMLIDRGEGSTGSISPPIGRPGSYVVSADGGSVVYTASTSFGGTQRLYVYDVATQSSMLITSGNDITRELSISANGRLIAFQTEFHGAVRVHDRDADGNGVFDESGVGTTTTVVAATIAPQTRNGIDFDSWNIVDLALSGDGQRLTVLIDLSTNTSLAFGPAAIEQIDMATGAVVATSPLTGLITDTNLTQLHATSDGTRTMFASLNPMIAADTNGFSDLYLWDLSGTGMCGGAPVPTPTPEATPTPTPTPTPPPPTPTPTPTPETFIHVALGDSYAAGEGVPPFVPGTENIGGDACHRSQLSYSRLNFGFWDPVATTNVLAEHTCSGAVINPDPPTGEPGEQYKIGIAYFGDTQENRALLALIDRGYDPADVDLVTMSAGGNDAGFADIVTACLIPNILNEIFIAYGDTPDELVALVQQLAHCRLLADGVGRVDFPDYLPLSVFDGAGWDGLADSDNQIAALGPDLAEAYRQIGYVFPDATVLQATYPSIVPKAVDFGGHVCGGILRQDAAYAAERVALINDQIDQNIQQVQAQGSNDAHLVDLERAFGLNPMCPPNPADALAHGIPQQRIIDLVRTFTDSPVVRPLVDEVFAQYRQVGDCTRKTPGWLTWIPGTEIGEAFVEGSCAGVNLVQLYSAIQDLMAYFGTFSEDDIKNLQASLAPGETPQERLENFTWLFHPNRAGVQVMACNYLNVWFEASNSANPPQYCAPSIVGAPGYRYEFDGVELTSMAPMAAEPGDVVPVGFNGFDPGSDVVVTFYSDPIDGGTYPVDANANLDAQILIPAELTPGVHTVEFAGTSNGSPNVIEVLIEIPGRPAGGDSYGMYLDGYEPFELVQIMVNRAAWVTAEANQDGGVHIEVPLSLTPSLTEVAATGATSGALHNVEIDPVPAPADINLGLIVEYIEGAQVDPSVASPVAAALEQLKQAQAKLDQTPADPHGAAAAIGFALQGLEPLQEGIGTGLLDWALDTSALLVDETLAGAEGDLTSATQFAEQGQALQEAGDYAGAADEFRLAIGDATGALAVCEGQDVTIDMNFNGGDGVGTDGDDVILGTSGDDVIDGGLGNDVICAGDGDDNVKAGPGDDVVLGGAGDDKLFGAQGADEMHGGDGADTIHGNRGDDVLFGDAGDDRIFGYANNDTISGGAGDDKLHGNFGDDIVNGGSGNDGVFGYGDDDELIGGTGDDVVGGNFGDDTISGGSGNDRLYGSDGTDTVNGGPGNDLVQGNSGTDTVNGGSGDDTLDGGINRDTCNGNSGVDTALRCEVITGVP